MPQALHQQVHHCGAVLAYGTTANTYIKYCGTCTSYVQCKPTTVVACTSYVQCKTTTVVACTSYVQCKPTTVVACTSYVQ